MRSWSTVAMAVGLTGLQGREPAAVGADTLTSFEQIWKLSAAEQEQLHPIKLEGVVVYYDPGWQALWIKFGDSISYLSLGPKAFPIKPGQRIVVEGSMRPTTENLVENPRVTIIEQSVALETVPTGGHIEDTARFNKRLVLVDGFIDKQVVSADGRRVQFDLVADNRLITGRLLLPEGTKAGNWEGSRVRVKGLYSATTDPTGGPPNIEIWIPRLEDFEVLGSLSQDPRFSQPVTPIDALAALPEGTPVHVAGVVHDQRVGKVLLVRDETGQVNLRSVQVRRLAAGERVEVWGRVARDGWETQLTEGIYERSSGKLPSQTTERPQPVRLADQLSDLTTEEAAEGRPVHLSGVITWAQTNADFFYLNDSSGGVRVVRPPEDAGRPIYTGRAVEVTGISAQGKFAPVVLARSVRLAAAVSLPEPPSMTLEQALSGAEEGRWVSMIGYVRSVTTDGLWTRLNLSTVSGEFAAMVPPSSRWINLPGSVVRLRGVCAALTNDKRQLTGVQLWVGAMRFVEVEEPSPAHPFELPLRSIASLRQFGSAQAWNRRVRVSGVVIDDEPGRLVRLQEGNDGLLVLSREPAPLALGDRIEVVGFPGRVNSRLVLREAMFRKVGTSPEPQPVPVRDMGPVMLELGGRLVRTEATLLDFNATERGLELVLQQGDVIFGASLAAGRSAALTNLRRGSLLALKGVYVVEYDEYRRPHDVRLQLRNGKDVRVLQHPSWWTVRRVAVVTGVIALAAVLGLAWAVTLQRRVREQTAVIREQFEKEKAARLEAAMARTSKLESLGVLAGGIAHDFNNLLTVITGNLSLASTDAAIPGESRQCIAESERAAVRARDLTQQLLTFAKGGDPVRTATRLEDVVRESAGFALHGAPVRCDFDFAEDLWPANADRGQISRVVQNIIINANQAMPRGGVILIALRNETVEAARDGLEPGRYVRLSFIDSGPGITAAHLPRIFEPYFTTKQHGTGLGLATVYSIVKKHQGHVEAASQPGQGTTFNIWLPAATTARAAIVREARIDTRAPIKSGRALVMDDEPAIRLLAGAVLRKMGFAVTAVDNGAQAVSAYAEAHAANRPFDLVVLDLTVAGAMGGAEAMQKLRLIDPDVRAVVSSGYSSDPIMANYRAHGFRGRAPKPYTAAEFSDVIGVVMRSDLA